MSRPPNTRPGRTSSGAEAQPGGVLRVNLFQRTRKANDLAAFAMVYWCKARMNRRDEEDESSPPRDPMAELMAAVDGKASGLPSHRETREAR